MPIDASLVSSTLKDALCDLAQQLRANEVFVNRLVADRGPGYQVRVRAGGICV